VYDNAAQTHNVSGTPICVPVPADIDDFNFIQIGAYNEGITDRIMSGTIDNIKLMNTIVSSQPPCSEYVVNTDCRIDAPPLSTWAEKVRIYPNPTIDKVFMDGLPEEKQTIRLANALGQQLLQTQNNAATYTFDISQYPSGTYWLDINSVVWRIVKP
jgi:hypothetical protein